MSETNKIIILVQYVAQKNYMFMHTIARKE